MNNTNIMMSSHKKKGKINMIYHRGFTLIELMVSLTLFSIVMVISIGSLLIMIDANAKAQALYSSMTNMSFALDSMTREMRTGYHYYCAQKNLTATDTDMSVPIKTSTQDCASGDFITFTRERDGRQFGYRLKGNQIEQYEDGSWISITSKKDVVIDTFQLVVKNSTPYEDSNDTAQPTIDLFIKGRMSNGLDVETVFSIQTQMVARRLDII